MPGSVSYADTHDLSKLRVCLVGQESPVQVAQVGADSISKGQSKQATPNPKSIFSNMQENAC